MKDTPSMRQYVTLKKEYKDCVLFFRMGDFYETFDEDARIMSKVLDIALTSRDRSEDKTPMAGIPHHALLRYLPLMVNAGYKVALCEQMEDPKNVKGIVRRDVVKIITPGTVIESEVQNPKKSIYVLAIHIPKGKKDGNYGIAYVDISKGSFFVYESSSYEKIIDIIQNLQPSEILYSEHFDERIHDSHAIDGKLMNVLSSISLTSLPAYSFESGFTYLQEHFGVNNLKGFVREDLQNSLKAAGAVLKYIEDTQKNKVTHIEKIEELQFSKAMYLDASTIRNLEIFSDQIRDIKKTSSLFDILDKTCTPMGTRLLRYSLIYPLTDKKEIEKRLDIVANMLQETDIDEIRQLLTHVSDIERINTRISFLSATPRDFLSLKQSLNSFLAILTSIKKAKFLSAHIVKLLPSLESIKKYEFIIEKITKTLYEDPSGIHASTGHIINLGINAQLDELKDVLGNGRGWLRTFQLNEIEKTGINSLKVHYNKVFGYYIEIPYAQAAKVPTHYQRRQTLVNAERFITPDLKEKEDMILHAQDRIEILETTIFEQFKSEMREYMSLLKDFASICSFFDLYVNFAYIAREYKYVKPMFIDDGPIRQISLKDARHPIIERTLESVAYIPNDIYLDCIDSQLLLVTGPNMAGKSSILRMTALISLMAQIGCFVPASEATLSVVDRIFSRVGARDSLATGESTFMVEMNETANILNNATDKSLIILDEIGRGTSTYDGVSIAYAIIEFLHERIRAKTIFATHYHELIDLENIYHRVKNFNVEVKEDTDTIIFLRKLVRGGTDKSYGIHVAKIAGIPKEVTKRAQYILLEYEKIKEDIKRANIPPLVEMMGVENKGEEKIPEKKLVSEKEMQVMTLLLQKDLNTITPLESLNILHEIHTILLDND